MTTTLYASMGGCDEGWAGKDWRVVDGAQGVSVFASRASASRYRRSRSYETGELNSTIQGLERLVRA
jgi:hypothetical protein